jgi:hypothetical protein
MDPIYYNISFFFLQETILLFFGKTSYKNKTVKRKWNPCAAINVPSLSIPSKEKKCPSNKLFSYLLKVPGKS